MGHQYWLGGAGLALASLLWCSQGQAAVLFRDDFNGSINSQWEVLRPVDGTVTVTADHLEMLGTSGDFNHGGYGNFYAIPTPTTGDFVATVKLNSFVWADVGQFDLLAFDDNDNYVKTDIGFFRNENGESVAGGWHVDGWAANPSQQPSWLRLSKVGNQYTASVSIDGNTFVDNPGVATYGNGRPLLLGFDVTTADARSVAAIDYFEVTGAPEPASLALLALGGVAVAARRRR